MIKSICFYEDKPWKPADPTRLDVKGVKTSDITHSLVMGLLGAFGMYDDTEKVDVAYYFANKDSVWLWHYSGDYYQIGKVKTLDLTFGEYSTDNLALDEKTDDKGGWFANNTQYFWPGFVDQAITAFVTRLNSEHPLRAVHSDGVEKLDIIKIRQDQKLEFESHYDYLDAMLRPFWGLVFDKTLDQMGCSGIIGAHGDKAYSYKEEWKDANIPFARGVLLYLLTYTQLLGDTPKYQSMQWVRDNYPVYLERIEAAEQQVLKERFNIEPKLVTELQDK